MSRPPRHHGRIICALACVVLMAGSGPSEAAPFTWTSSGTAPLADGSGSWNATGGTNWFNGTTYGAWGNTNADMATFGVGNGAAGTITVGGVTANGITFDSAGSGNYTLSSGTITMAGTTPTITVNATGTTTLTSVLAGSAGFTKSGAGTLLLGTGNTYTGTTTISQGAVRVTGITNTLGNGSTGAVNLNGGTLIGAWTAATTSSWAITVGASGGTFLGSGSNGQLNLTANSLYGSGVLTLRSENGFNRFFNGNATTTQNNFSGKWILDGSGGAFWDYFDNSSFWGTGTGDDVITFTNNSTVLIRGGTVGSSTKGITFGTGGGTLNTGAGVSTIVSAKLSGISTGTVTFGPTATGGIITLANTSNSYAGDTVIAGKTSGSPWVRLGAADVVPDGAGKGNVFLINSGARGGLDLNGFNDAINGLSSFNGTSFASDSIVDNLAASTSVTLTVGGNDASATFAGVIQNTGSSATLAVTKIGTGTQTLSNANTYSGATTISGGVLALGAGGAAGSLASSSAVTIASGASLDFRRSNDYGNFSNAISGAGGVAVTSGTVTFTGSNSYGGSTTVNGGQLVAGSSNAFGSSTTPLVINAGTASLGGFSVAVGALSGSSGGRLTTSNAAGTATFTTSVASGTSTFAGSIANNGSGVVAITKQGGGTLVLGSNNTYTGTTTISQGAVQVSGITNTLGNTTTGNVVLDGGQLVAAWTNNQIPGWSIRVGSAGGAIVGSGSGGRWGFAANTISGSGTLTLQGANNFSRFSTVTNTQANFSGKWVIDGAGTGIFVDEAQGNVWGTGTGTDVVTMVNNGQILIRGGTVGSATQGFTIGSGGGLFAGAGGITATIAAQVSSTGSDRVTFRPSQNGVLILSNMANSYSGDTYVAGDSFGVNHVRLGDTGVIPNGAGKGNVVLATTNGGAAGLDLNGFSATINGLSSLGISGTLSTESVVDNLAASTSATLTLGSNDASTTFAGVIRNSGSGATIAIRKIGAGGQTLLGVNTYAGATTISGGTLALGVNGSFANSPAITVGDVGSVGAVLDISAKSGTFSFGSGQTVGGSGTLRMGIGDSARFAGVFAPGNSPGLFTLDGGTTLLSGTTQMEIFGSVRGTGYDAVDLINAAVLDYAGGTLFLDFGSTLGAQQSFQLFGDGSATINGSLSAVTIAGANYAGLTFTRVDGVWTTTGSSPSNQTLTYTEATGTLVIVPEPTAVLLACIGGIMAWSLRRRRAF